MNKSKYAYLLKCMQLIIGFLFLISSFNTFSSDYTQAQYKGKINLSKIGCNKGDIWDPRNGGECWSCDNAKRDVLYSVASDKACFSPAKTVYSEAKEQQKNITSCAKGQIQASGACWTCPSGYTHDLAQPINSDKVCFKKHAKEKKKMHETKKIDKYCKLGGDGILHKGKCYRCFKAETHDIAVPFNESGICVKPAYNTYKKAQKKSTLSGLSCPKGMSYDPIDGGSCWSCPSGYKQTANAINSKKACVKNIAEKHFSAKKIKSSKLSSQGCSKGQFVDPRNGGECWSCPSSNPTRTTYSVTSKNACASNSCGGLNERPCLVWERVPSCNNGLLEDPGKNQCTKSMDLVCETTITTLSGLYNLLSDAESKGEKEFQKALDSIPGARNLIASVKSSGDEVKKALENELSKLDIKPLDEQFQNILEKPDMFDQFSKVAKQVEKSEKQLLPLLLNKKLMCGDLTAMISELNKIGFNQDLVAQTPKGSPLDFILSPAHALSTSDIPNIGFNFKILPVPIKTAKVGVAEVNFSGLIGLGIQTNFVDSFSWSLNRDIIFDVSKKEEKKDDSNPSKGVTLKSILGLAADKIAVSVGPPRLSSDTIDRLDNTVDVKVAILKASWDLDNKPVEFKKIEVDKSQLAKLFSLTDAIKKRQKPKLNVNALLKVGGSQSSSLIINSTHKIKEPN